MRVVSLVPAGTEIVAALGAGGWLAGVSHECDWPPEVRMLPRVTRSSVDASLSSRVLDGNAYTSRPGPRLVEGVELLTPLIGG